MVEEMEFGADPIDDLSKIKAAPGTPVQKGVHPAILALAKKQEPFHALISQFHRVYEEIPQMTTRQVDVKLQDMFGTLLDACETVGISKMSVPPLKDCCGKRREWKDEAPAAGGLRLGDKLAWILGKLGFKKCEGCKKRQEALNRFRILGPRDDKKQ